MFYRVPRKDEEEPEPLPQCFNVNAEILETARKVIAINLVTVTLLMFFIPHNIYNILVYFSSIQHPAFCKNQSDPWRFTDTVCYHVSFTDL